MPTVAVITVAPSVTRLIRATITTSEGISAVTVWYVIAAAASEQSSSM